MNSKRQGAVGVGAAIAHYTAQGHAVFIPVSDISRYDFILDREGKLFRVEVKTSTHKNKSGNIEVGLRTHGGNQSWNKVSKLISSEDCDLVFIHVFGASYEFPVEVLHGRSTITLNPSHDMYRL